MLTIGFVAAGLNFTGNSLDTRSLGGSETAMLCMARELSKLGHQVHVFCFCDAPGLYGKVSYFPIANAQEQIATIPYDVLIASRLPNVLKTPGKIGLRILWCHDVLLDKDALMGGLYRTDFIMLLSKYQLENYTEGVAPVADFAWLTRNGIDLDLIESNIQPKDPNKLIYISRPERGLQYLLGEVMPKLLKEKPSLRLAYCSYSLDDLVLTSVASDTREICKSLTAALGDRVIDLGHLKKEELYREISSSKLLLYPTTWPEISCIAALESQACGTPIITTNKFALPETVGPNSGILIDGMPPESEYIDKFVAETLSLLNDEPRYESMVTAGKDWIIDEGYTWEAIAKDWETKFQSMLFERWTNNKTSVLLNLERYGDLAAAEIIAKNEHLPQAKALKEKVVEARTKRDFPSDTEEAKHWLEKALPGHQLAFQLLSFHDFKPKRILDFQCGYDVFGMVAKKMFPEAEVTFVDEDQDVISQLEVNLRQTDLEAHLLHAGELCQCKGNGELFDLVYLGDYLSRVSDPRYALERASKICSKDGFIVLAVSCGPIAATAKELKGVAPSRLWSLSYPDLQNLFSSSNDFKASYKVTGSNAVDETLGRWIVIARPSDKYGKIDIQRKRLSTRPYQSLAACMISGEEEDNIAGCIKSFLPIVDKIVVIDTTPEGSTDCSGEIAERLGAEVRKVEFDHFSQVRNESIKDVGTDWFLWIDADERLVDPKNLKKYLEGTIYNGFAIKQIHLSVDDTDKSFDTPVRLIRTNPDYGFVGCIHEHCEDLGKGPYDHAVSPVLALPDVDIAHFGYICERVRRTKCSQRNMALLQRDLKENPERVLGQVLLIRDYLNMVKWELNDSGHTVVREEIQEYLQVAIDTFLSKFGDRKSKYYGLVWPFYQEALQILGKNGVPYRDNKFPPFEVNLALSGSMGGSNNSNVTAKKLWYINEEQCVDDLSQKAAELVTRLGVAEKGKYEELMTNENEDEVYGLNKAMELLEAGIQREK